ncbi:hypothetical protein ACFL00_02100 [Pseudomonadota bacterium]
MSDEKYPNIAALVEVVDGLIGCVFGLLKFLFWAIVVGIIISLSK